ncbi:hypothetical protein GEMRC1_005101 [Eukaryota sp. GEM-RC1]
MTLVVDFFSSQAAMSLKLVLLQLLLLLIGVFGCALSVLAFFSPIKLLNFIGFWVLSVICLLLKPHYPNITLMLFSESSPSKHVSYTAYILIAASIPFFSSCCVTFIYISLPFPLP